MKELQKKHFFQIRKYFLNYLTIKKSSNEKSCLCQSSPHQKFEWRLKGDQDNIKPFLIAERISNETKFFVRDPIF